MTTFTVTATLPYALRNPECTPTSQEELMRMAAVAIDELTATNSQLGEALESCQEIGLRMAEKIKKLEASENA